MDDNNTKGESITGPEPSPKDDCDVEEQLPPAEGPSEQLDEVAEHQAYSWDTVYMYVIVLSYGISVLAVMLVSSTAKASPDVMSAALGFICCCFGLLFVFDLWLASNILKNRQWAFYVSLIFVLLGLVMPRGNADPAAKTQVLQQVGPLIVLGWLSTLYRVAYLIARVAGLGPKPG